MKNTIYGSVALLLLTACAISKSVPASTTVPPTESSNAPTPTLMDDPILFGEVTFDGNECTVAGPLEVPRGYYYFILNDMSDKNLQLWVNQILEGKTFEDLLDWQPEPGEYVPPPKWIEHPSTTYSVDAGTMVHVLDQVGVYTTLVGGYNPSSLWFCEPFRVVEADSD
jgi:hypothetical protein